MNVLLLLIGRFTDGLRSDVDDSMHFALVALAKVPFPLAAVLKKAFWLIVWISALFISLVCWDIAGDEVSFAESVWIPLVTMSYPLCLWWITVLVKYRDGSLLSLWRDVRSENNYDTDNDNDNDKETLLMSGIDSHHIEFAPI